MKITWLGPYQPVPGRSGGDLRSYYLMRELCRRGAVIDGYFLDSHGNEVTQFLKSSNVLSPSSWRQSTRGILQRLSGIPYKIGKYYHPSIEESIGYTDWLYVDHLHMSINLPDEYDGKIWLDEHNLEYRLWKQYLDFVGFPLKKLFDLEVQAMKTYELETIRKVTGTGLPVSEVPEELAGSESKKIVNISNGVPDQWLEQGESSLDSDLNAIDKFGYIGSYDWRPNRDAIDMFLNEVWRDFYKHNTDTELVLAGKNPDKNWETISGVSVKGYVDSTEKFFEFIDVLIIPLFIGAGTRLKALEAAARGVPILSTEKGIEGLGFNNCPTCESLTGFENLMNEAVGSSRRLLETARENYEKVQDKYRWKTIGDRLWRNLNSL